MKSTALAFTLAAALLLVAGCGESSAANVLRFTAIPDSNTTELKEKLDPVAAYLSQELGVDVEYVPTSSYSASVEAFKNGDIQLAWFGGLTGVQARAAVDGAHAIAQGRIDPEFKSYFVANASTGIETDNDFPMGLRGKTFTFGSNGSTSGRLMPESFIRQFTRSAPEDFFATNPNAYSDGHDHTAVLVQAGTFEAGAMNYKTYDEMVAKGKIDPAVCRIVWVTPAYPDYNFTAHPILEERFGAGFTKKLQSALVGIDDPALLAAISRPEGIIEAIDDDFLAIEELATELGFIRNL